MVSLFKRDCRNPLIMSRHLVVGLGEVGKALKQVLEEKFFVDGKDKEPLKSRWVNYEVIHFCLPWPCEHEHCFDCDDKGCTHDCLSSSKCGSIKTMKGIVAEFGGPNTLIINHSSTPEGATEQLGSDAVHSPIRGVHPNLAQGIKTFVKYFGGSRALEAAQYFKELGIETRITLESRETEALKQLDTLQYGEMISLEKDIYYYCKEKGYDFELVYSHANQTYNEGYNKLLMPHVVRPFLKHTPGGIGGHCVIPNARLLRFHRAIKLFLKNLFYQKEKD